MKTLYEAQITATAPFTTPNPILVPDDIIYVNIYNISPHRVTISLSGGYPDQYLPPFYYLEGLYMGVQGGTGLTIGQHKSHARIITIAKVVADTGLQTLPGDLSIIGFMVDENWQGKRPLIAGAISPTTGAGVATSIVNTGQPVLTPIITANASGSQGNIRVNNDGSMTVQLQSLGAATTFISLANGTGVAPGTMVLGDSSNLANSTFWGTLGKILADPNAPLQNIQSDGNGLLTAHEFKSAVSTVSGNQNGYLLTDAVTGRTWAWGIVQTSGELTFFESLAGKTGLIIDSANAFMANGGAIRLLAGIQESRSCSGRGVAAAAGNNWGGWIAFQHDMTNLPSSITLTQSLNTNVASATAVDITKTGFRLELVATAAGNFVWEGTYTTVGN